MRTNCVATRLDGGHANNALPQRAQAQHQLPDPSRALAGGDTPAADQGDRRPAGHGPLRLRRWQGGRQDPRSQERRAPAVEARRWSSRWRRSSRRCGRASRWCRSWMPVPRMRSTPRPPACPPMASPAWPSMSMTQRAHGRDERIRVAAFYKAQRVLLPLHEGADLAVARRPGHGVRRCRTRLQDMRREMASAATRTMPMLSDPPQQLLVVAAQAGDAAGGGRGGCRGERALEELADAVMADGDAEVVLATGESCRAAPTSRRRGCAWRRLPCHRCAGRTR